jgi:hypothetical protein
MTNKDPALLAHISGFYMKTTNNKTETDVMVQYLKMIERGEADEFLYIASTEQPKDSDYLKYTSERDGKVTEHYIVIPR